MNSLFDGFTNGVEIPRHWENATYGNDACPSYYKNGYQIWIDHWDPNQRELGADKPRFSITLEQNMEKSSLHISLTGILSYGLEDLLKVNFRNFIHI